MTRRISRFILATAVLVCASARAARADAGDGVYGRFDGDLELRAHAGAAIASGGPALDASLAALYMSTAGIYVHYTDACGSSAPLVTRSIATGVHLAPLFLLRGALDAERGPAFVDLLIDSFAFEIGAAWSAARPAPGPTMPAAPPAPTPSATFDETPGLEAALGIAIPLIARASGPFIGLRAAARWRPADFAPGAATTLASRGALLSITFGWHQMIDTHLIDPGDRVMR